MNVRSAFATMMPPSSELVGPVVLVNSKPPLDLTRIPLDIAVAMVRLLVLLSCNLRRI